MRIYYLSYCLLANRTFILQSYRIYRVTHIINVPKSGMYTVGVQNGILYEQERLNIKYSFIY